MFENNPFEGPYSNQDIGIIDFPKTPFKTEPARPSKAKRKKRKQVKASRKKNRR